MIAVQQEAQWKKPVFKFQKENSTERDNEMKDETESPCPHHRHYFNQLPRQEG